MPAQVAVVAAAPATAPPAPTPSLRADWPAAYRPRVAATLPEHEYGTDGLMGRLAFSELYDPRAVRTHRLGGLTNFRTDPYQR